MLRRGLALYSTRGPIPGRGPSPGRGPMLVPGSTNLLTKNVVLGVVQGARPPFLLPQTLFLGSMLAPEPLYNNISKKVLEKCYC